MLLFKLNFNLKTIVCQHHTHRHMLLGLTMLTNAIYDSTGSYDAALIMAMGLLLMAAVFVPAAGAQVTVEEGYDYTRLADEGITLNVYNWGQYIADGSDGSMEVIKEFEKAASKGYYAKNITTVVQPEAQQEMVIDRKIAMYVCGSWMPNNLRESAGEDFRWGSIRFPLVENGVDDGSSLSYGCYGISINKDATKEEQV